MNVRLLVLFPNSADHCALGVTWLARFRAANPTAWLGAIIPDELRWVVGEQSIIDHIWRPSDNSRKLKQEVLPLVPDYVLDLSISGKYRRFKRILGLIDFTPSYRKLKPWIQIPIFFDQIQSFNSYLDDLLSFFEIGNNKILPWEYPLIRETQKKRLPSSFLDKYIALRFEGELNTIEGQQAQYENYLARIEFPVVLIGPEEFRPLADRLGTKVGCTVFNACGHIDDRESALLIAGSAYLLGHDGMSTLLAHLYGLKTHSLLCFQGMEEPNLSAQELRDFVK